MAGCANKPTATPCDFSDAAYGRELVGLLIMATKGMKEIIHCSILYMAWYLLYTCARYATRSRFHNALSIDA
jgi:hypothetical protein